MSLYPRRPGAKYDDIEARPDATVTLGGSRLRLVSSSIEPHGALPGPSVPANSATTGRSGLVDGYEHSATFTDGDILRVVVRMKDRPTFPAAP